MTEAPKLLIEWSSPWQEFTTAIGPALSRSPAQLAGEARTGLFPYRGMLLSWIAEAGLLAAVIVIPSKIASLQPYSPPPMPKYDVIYFSGDELPRTEDAGGAQAGTSGRAGGQEAHHPTQAIRVARGESLKEKVVDAPKLKLPASNSAVANLLAYNPVPGPAPVEGLPSSRPPLIAPLSVVPPTPDIGNRKLQASPSLRAAVIPPPPSATQRNFASQSLPGDRMVQVVPPPVSAPEQLSNSEPKLTLPAPAPIAPPPQLSSDIPSRGPGFGSGQLRSQVIPPAVQIGEVTATEHQGMVGLGKPSVIPPPVQMSGAAGTESRGGASLGHPNVIPPPVQASGVDSVRGGSATELSTAVVPPAPNMSRNVFVGGSGTGKRGPGFGGALDAGNVLAPPKRAGGSPGGTGVVVSSQPGSQVGIPGNAGPGALAMSPAGGSKPGLGGSGGGKGIGHGSGPGSGFSGEGSGTAAKGTGHGADEMARGGTSVYPGAGGTGSGTVGKPAMPGVSVRGGSNIITLPSFGGGDASPSAPVHASLGSDPAGSGVTIVATPRSGGAFNFYGGLKGDRVYSIYFQTSLGTAVMELADPTSAVHSYAEQLTPPQPMRTTLPAGLRRSRLVLACILDRSGVLKDIKVLEPGPPHLTTKVMAALANWKFRPAMRGDQPVEVNAILGFDIDTR